MIEIRVRAQEGSEPEPYLLWDSTWNPAEMWADWSLNSTTAVSNAGGLTSARGLETAVILSLFTWKRAEDYEIDAAAYPDHKGWWGDAVDVDTSNGETELGSKLWLLLRSALTQTTPQLAKTYASEALQPLIAQGACARINVDATSNFFDRIELGVSLYGEDGSVIYKQNFALLWQQEFSASR